MSVDKNSIKVHNFVLKGVANMILSKRTVIRAAMLSAAVTASLGVKAWTYSSRANDSEQALKYSYYRAMEDLSSSTDSISQTLEKELYAGSPQMHGKLSSQLLNYAANAKACLSQLPVDKSGLGNTYKFLSQVGNFSQAMSEKLSRGEKLTDDEYKKLTQLHKYSKDLCDAMWKLNDDIETGQTLVYPSDEQPDSELLSDGKGFDKFENSFENYPKLIYDGPFSDNILEKDPELLKGKEEVSREKALEKCILTLGIRSEDVPNLSYEYGKMPSYRFYDDDGKVSCAVTKKGGLVSYFLKTRRANSSDISNDDAIGYAEKFLESIGVTDMESTYYEVYDNVCTINFAYKQSDVLMYTDLIKVQVAMDNGDIVGYDARGYIVNHKERKKGDDLISVKRASKEISPVLDIKSEQLCFIPTEGTKEVLCYEFKCRSDTNRDVLVYINAKTAAEEQILMLEESESGVLTV